MEKFSRLTFFLALTLSITFTAAAFTGSGAGTQSDPYQISNLSELNQTRNNLSANYELVSDINATPTENWNNGEGFTPIGNETTDFKFAGKFQGNNHEISGLFINSSTQKIGLFGFTDNAKIKNLSLTGLDFQVRNYGQAGGLIGEASYTEVWDVGVSGNISGEGDLGLLIGTQNNGEVNTSYTSGRIYGTDGNIGGLIARNSFGTVRNTYSTANLVSGEYANAAGLIYDLEEGTVEKSYSAGELPENSYGVIGSYDCGFTCYGGNIVDLYWDINNSGTTSGIGGDSGDVTGLNNSQIRSQGNLSGFDFSNTWELVEGSNDNYPVLQSFNRNSKPPQVDKDDIRPLVELSETGNLSFPQQVKFTDSYTGANSWNWSWGDGTYDSYNGFSGEYGHHEYAGEGNYTINLTVSNGQGSDSVEFEITVNDYFAGGTGTEKNPFKISTAEQLQNMNKDLLANYELINDVDASGTETWNSGLGFRPVGNETNNGDHRFKGKLDGEGYSVKNLTISRLNEGINTGLFGVIDQNAVVGNISIEKADIKGDDNSFYTGIIAGISHGTIKTVYTGGEVHGDDVGGITGLLENTGVVEKTYSTADVLASQDGGSRIGGLIGYLDRGDLIDSFSTGVVNGTSSDVAGAVGRYDNGDIYNPGQLTDVYWDVQSSGQNKGTNFDTGDISGLNTFEFDDKSKLSDLDFTNTWEIVDRYRNYPSLQLFNRDSETPIASIQILQLNKTGEDEFTTSKPVSIHDRLTGGTSYTWKVNGTTVSSSEDFTYDFSSPGVYEVSLNISNSNGEDSTSRLIEVFNYPCTSGSLNGTCVVNRTWQDVPSGELINGSGNLVLGSNAVLNSSLRNSSFRISMGGQTKLNSGSSIRGNVNITSDRLEVEDGATINATGLGYQGGASGAGSGPGGGSFGGYDYYYGSGTAGGGGGAGHGGRGANGSQGQGLAGSSYGSYISPSTFGSGGGGGEDLDGGDGGGRIMIEANETSLNGLLSVRAQGISYDYEDLGGGGGSGGAVNIESENISGSGKILASGESGIGDTSGGGGAGGRVSLRSENYDFKGDINISAGSGGSTQPQSGTIFNCNTVESMNCPGGTDNGVNLATDLGKDSNGTYLNRIIDSEWSQGYLAWTENTSRTSIYDPDWSGSIESNFTVNGLAENLEFKVTKREMTPIKVNESRSTLEKNISNNSVISLSGGSNYPPVLINLYDRGADDAIELVATENNVDISGYRVSSSEISSGDVFTGTLDRGELQLRSESNSGFSSSVGDNGADTVKLYDSNDNVVDCMSVGQAGCNPSFEITPNEVLTYRNVDDDTDTADDWETSTTEDQYRNELNPGQTGQFISNYSGYGKFVSKPVDAGRLVDWTQARIDSFEPNHTDYNISFAQNSTGKWVYSDEISSLNDSQFIRYNITLSTENSSKTPEIREIILDYDYDTSVIDTQDSGSSGEISFNATLTGEDSFRILESVEPTYGNVSEEASVVNPEDNTTLSVDVADVGSGVSEVRLAIGERFYYTGETLSIPTYTNGLEFNNDGKKMFLASSYDDKIYSFNLTTPYDFSTGTQTNSIDTQDSKSQGIEFNNDGTKLYETGGSSDKIYSYSLTTPYDLSTATYTNSINTKDNYPRDIEFNKDGTKMYETGVGSSETYTYSLTTPYNLSTAKFTSSKAAKDGNPVSIEFNNDGTKFYELNSYKEAVYIFNLSTPYNLTTSKYTGREIRLQDRDPRAIAFNDDITRMYEAGSIYNDLYTYSSGVVEKPRFTETFSNIKDGEATVEWSNSSFSGDKALFGYRFILEDAAGNVNKTGIRTFNIDGKKPVLSGLNYPSVIDVNDSPASINLDASDSPAGLDKGIIMENSTGAFSNRTMTLGSNPEFSTVISKQDPGYTDFSVFVNDTVGNTASKTGVIEFRNISVDLTAENSVLSGEQVTLSGSSKALPDAYPVEGPLQASIDTGNGFQDKATVSVNSLGNFGSSVPSVDVAGTHILRLSYTDPEGVSGFETEKFNVSLDISSPEAVFGYTNTGYADVDSDSRTVNLTSFVSNSTDSKVSGVSAEVEMPNGSAETYSLSSTEDRTNSGIWYKEVDTVSDFGDLEGRYNVSYTAETERGIGSNVDNTSFYIRNISIQNTVGDGNVTKGEKFTLSGDVSLEPSGEELNGNLSVEKPSDTVGIDVSGNVFNSSISVSEVGRYNLNLSYYSENDITGNSTAMVDVYSLVPEIISTRVEGVEKNVVFKDSSSDVDLNFTDEVTANVNNPGVVEDLDLNYEFPAGFKERTNQPFIGTLAPGESSSNGPEIDVGPSVKPGNYTINVSTSSAENLVGRDSKNIRVFAKSESDYLNVENGVGFSREQSQAVIRGNVTDTVGGAPISGINTSLVVRDSGGNPQQTLYSSSDSSGEVSFDVNLSQLEQESDKVMSMRTLDEPGLNVNSSEGTLSNRINFDLQAQMSLDQQPEVSPVQRKGIDSSSLTGILVDSTDSPVEDAAVSLELPQQTLEKNTSASGQYTFSYNPNDRVKPGLKTVNFTAEKKSFTTFEFQDTVEVRGNLTIEGQVSRDFLQRGSSERLDSVVRNSFEENVTGDVVWKLNSTTLGSGANINSVIPAGLERGVYTLNATTNREHYNDDRYSRQINLNGIATVDLKPDDFSINPGNTVTFSATVTNQTGGGIENYPVEFLVDGTKSSEITTNSSGIATFQHTFEQGETEITAEIEDSENLLYNTSTASDSTQVRAEKMLKLKKYKLSEDDIYRYLRTPFRTVISIKLLETTNTTTLAPASGETVNVTVNGSEKVSCITGPDGTCQNTMFYNPGTVPVGNLKATAFTHRDGWTDANRSKTLTLRGDLNLELQSPENESNWARGDNMSLEASVTSAETGDVDVPVNWTLDGARIGEGESHSYKFPAGATTGKRILEAKADAPFYRSASKTAEIYVLGSSKPVITAPDNSSEKGYGDSFQTACEVRSKGVGIEDYPVEFVTNSSGSFQEFESSRTSSTGTPEATARWNPVDRNTTVAVGCKIQDNRSLGFTATKVLDTRVFKLFDNKPPEISGIQISPPEVDPGSEALITFNTTEESEIENVNVDVIDPQLDSTDLTATETVGTGYEASYQTPEEEGAYSVVVTVTDTSGNFARERKSFSVNPGGEISIGKQGKVIDDMRSDAASSFEVKVNAFVNETAESLNITAEKDSQSSLPEFNTSKYECGDLSQGSYCNTTFEVTMPSGTAPTDNSPVFAEFRSTWNSGQERSSTSEFLEVVVQPNAVLETVSFASGQTTHKTRENITVELRSRGNVPVDSIKPEFKTDGPLVTELYGVPESLSGGSQRNVNVDVGVPEGTSPGDYEGTLELDSDNAPRETTAVTVNIPEDPSYSGEQKVSAGAISRSSGTLTEVELNSTGNVDVAFSPSFINGPSNAGCGSRLSADGFTLQKQSDRKIKINYDFGGFGFQGNCNPDLELQTQGGVSNTKTVDLDIDVLRFSVDKSVEKITARPGDEASFDFSAQLGGEPETKNLEVSAKLGSKKIQDLTREQSGNNFTLTYTIPEVDDASTHDLKFNVTSTSAGVTARKTSQDTVNVPDMTPPSFGSFEVDDKAPDESINLDIPVSDNSKKGVENVSVEFQGNTSKKVYMEEQLSNWTAEVSDLNSGTYTAVFRAEDGSGLNATTTKRFRVSEPVTFNDSFTSPAGEPVESRITVEDSVTGKVLQDSTSQNKSKYNLTLNKGNYDLRADLSGSQVSLENASVEENSNFRASELEPGQTSELAPESAKARVVGIGVQTNIKSDSGTLTFDYSDRDLPQGTSPTDLKVSYCEGLDYNSLSCNSSLEKFDVSVLNVNRARQTITVNVPGFSSYTLYAPSETSNESQQDEEDQVQQQPSQDTGGGGGGSGGISDSQFDDLQEAAEQTQQQVEQLSDSVNSSEDSSAGFSSSSISAQLKPGESKVSSITVTNRESEPQIFQFEAEEPLIGYMQFEESLEIEPGSSRTLNLNITAPASELPGSYSGSLSVSSSKINTDIPVNIQVLPPDKKLLDLSVTPVFESVKPGENLKIQTTLNNQGYARNVDVEVSLSLIDPETNETLATKGNTYAVGTTLTRVMQLSVPEDTERKPYEVSGTARYTNLDVPRVANTITTVKVSTPLWERTVLGMAYSTIGVGLLVLIITSLIGYSVYQYRRKKLLEKKRYMENIDLDTIPSGGKREAYMGSLAEMGKRTFMNIDDLTTHALVAGATGSGKTVTGQVMVEEALEEGANVIVLDPTAQWTGFLRENEDSGMLQLMQEFGMSMEDARAYDGNIRAVEPDEKEIDITPYLEDDEEGNIIIFSLHKLDSKNIDEFVDNTIQQIFDANLPERNQLETLVVYDEVHRLLEKFGGSGDGLKQLERGAREFRKWGIGMLLLSQVISDFPSEIRTNVGTKIQMRTRNQSDLDHYKDNYGMDTVRSIVKANVGSGMIQNSDYNGGNPYFVNFRPLKHSVHRLSDEELDKYEEYNRSIDEVEEKIQKLEDQGQEVYEYRSNLKLCRKNLRKGSFNLVDIYLDELKDQLQNA